MQTKTTIRDFEKPQDIAIIESETGVKITPYDYGGPARPMPVKPPMHVILSGLRTRIPKKYIERIDNRKVKDGIPYITWQTAHAMLDFFTGGNYETEVTNMQVLGSEAVVTVKLTIHSGDGSISREDIGTAPLKSSSTSPPFMVAQRRAFKRAASQFGLASHLKEDANISAGQIEAQRASGVATTLPDNIDTGDTWGPCPTVGCSGRRNMRFSICRDCAKRENNVSTAREQTSQRSTQARSTIDASSGRRTTQPADPSNPW